MSPPLRGPQAVTSPPGANAILGAQTPKPFGGSRRDHNRWRAFYTQQHGDNPTYELIAAPGH